MRHKSKFTPMMEDGVMFTDTKRKVLYRIERIESHTNDYLVRVLYCTQYLGTKTTRAIFTESFFADLIDRGEVTYE